MLKNALRSWIRPYWKTRRGCMTVLKSSGLSFQRFSVYGIIRRRTLKPAKSNNLWGGYHIQGKEQRTPEPVVNFSSIYDTFDFLKTSSKVGAVRIASAQASSSFDLAFFNFSEAHSGNRPKRLSSSLFSKEYWPLTMPSRSMLVTYSIFSFSSIVSSSCQIRLFSQSGKLVIWHQFRCKLYWYDQVRRVMPLHQCSSNKKIAGWGCNAVERRWYFLQDYQGGSK